MDLIDPKLAAYSQSHSTPESALLSRINRETHANVLMPQMLSGHLQGRLLSMISKMIRPKSILEIGTYTGYSAICLSEGLEKGGKIITLDNNEELAEMVNANFNVAGLMGIAECRIGDATKLIPMLSGPFDLVFIDADKENYCHYYDLVFNLVNLGGYILADNVLWSGKVLQEKPDKDTRAILEFNRKIQLDERVENILLPVRDGIMIARKLAN